MDFAAQQRLRIIPAARKFWADRASDAGYLAATGDLLSALWEFLRNSTPSRRRPCFGDADDDWDYRVNTTSGAVGWRDRLLGVLHSPYQPTEPAIFHEMLASLAQQRHLNFAEFTFMDLGCGKGRSLLMATDYPFRRIIGVEILPALHEVAQQNLAVYQSAARKCFAVECICADATTIAFPEGPLLVYLFNPFPEAGLRRALENLKEALAVSPRAAYVLYHNPQLERLVSASGCLQKIAGTHQYSIFAAAQ